MKFKMFSPFRCRFCRECCVDDGCSRTTTKVRDTDPSSAMKRKKNSQMWHTKTANPLCSGDGIVHMFSNYVQSSMMVCACIFGNVKKCPCQIEPIVSSNSEPLREWICTRERRQHHYKLSVISCSLSLGRDLCVPHIGHALHFLRLANPRVDDIE